MKARTHPVVLSLAVACWWACCAHAAPETGFVFLDPDDPAFAPVRAVGDRVADQAGNALILELRRVLVTSTAPQAVGIVHLKDYKLPAAAPGGPRVTALVRTSTQVRAPANTPDAADQAALDRIGSEISNGDDVSKVLLQRVTLPNKPAEWRVYRPLVVLKQCVDCHGPTPSLAPGVSAALQQAYPNDQATGYRAGQWRGLIRVSMEWSGS